MEIMGKRASIILEYELLLHWRQAKDTTHQKIEDIDVVSKICCNDLSKFYKNCW